MSTYGVLFSASKWCRVLGLFLLVTFPALAQSQVLYYWHFNNLPDGTLESVGSDVGMPGAAVISYPGTGAGYIDRVNDGTLLNTLEDAPAGMALRVRNPSDTRSMVITLPTTDYQAPVLRYAVKRTNTGVSEHALSYQISVSGEWIPFGDPVEVDEDYSVFTFDFAEIDTADDNAEFAVRILFTGPEAGGDSGNNRFDNVLLEGVPLPGTASVTLNEVNASNGTVLADEDGDYEDWIELYNGGSQAVALGGHGLSDDPDDPYRWVFPDVTLPSGGFLVVFASGKDRRIAGHELHEVTPIFWTVAK